MCIRDRLRDGKWTDFEGGIRVPCIMQWPGKIPAGTTNNEIVGIIDILPTFCAITGEDVPSDRIIDGKDITPYMFNKKVKTPIHETFIVPGSIIRHQNWKLLTSFQKIGGNGNKGKQGRVPAESGTLFNLKEDLSESTDVSKENPEKVKELEKIMKEFTEELEKNKRPIARVESL